MTKDETLLVLAGASATGGSRDGQAGYAKVGVVTYVPDWCYQAHRRVLDATT